MRPKLNSVKLSNKTRAGSPEKNSTDSKPNSRLTPKQLHLLRFIRDSGQAILSNCDGTHAIWPKGSATWVVANQSLVEQLAYRCLDELSEYFGGVLGITRITYSQTSEDAPPLGPLKRPGEKLSNGPGSKDCDSTTSGTPGPRGTRSTAPPQSSSRS